MSQDSTAPLPSIRTSIPGPLSRALAERLRAVESPNVTYLADDFPVFWASASGNWVTDVDGNTFLDATSAFGVSAIGHCHPAVVEAVRNQSARLIHGMGDVHPSDVKVALCEAISSAVSASVGGSDWQVILGQNGSDAVEAALKCARLATVKPGVIAFDGGYHGLSYGALNVTARADFRVPFADQLGHFSTHLPYGCEPGDIDVVLARPDVGAVIVEPIQGRGGIVVPPAGWLRSIKSSCERHGALLILDEIFTGWGRTGHWFAAEHDGVLPDILCVGKAMGGGLPISACLARKPLMATWGVSRGEALHTSTFLGNPLACAAALAAIDVMQSNNLPNRSMEMGGILTDSLHALQGRHPDVIIDIRGRGLMIGVQLSTSSVADAVVRNALANGLIVLPAGDGSVIEIVPALTISQHEAALIVSILEDSLLRG